MKIIDFDEMVELPVGSVFCKYEPCVLDARWLIKTGETHTSLFNGQRLFIGVMELEPWALNMDDMPSGKGTFATEMTIADARSFDIGKKGDLFAVLEDYEIIEMIRALIWALKRCEGDFEMVFKKAYDTETSG